MRRETKTNYHAIILMPGYFFSLVSARLSWIEKREQKKKVICKWLFLAFDSLAIFLSAFLFFLHHLIFPLSSLSGLIFWITHTRTQIYTQKHSYYYWILMKFWDVPIFTDVCGVSEEMKIHLWWKCSFQLKLKFVTNTKIDSSTSSNNNNDNETFDKEIDEEMHVKAENRNTKGHKRRATQKIAAVNK